MKAEQKKKALQQFAEQQYEKHLTLTTLVFKSLEGSTAVAGHNQQTGEIIITPKALRNFPLVVIQHLYLHELAHAINGNVDGHNEDWLKVCKQIGCKLNKAVIDIDMITALTSESAKKLGA